MLGQVWSGQIQRSEVSADGIGFGDVQVAEEVHGLAPMVPGLDKIACSMGGMGEVVVSACLLVPVTDLGGQGGGPLMVALPLSHVTEVVQRAGLAALVVSARR